MFELGSGGSKIEYREIDTDNINETYFSIRGIKRLDRKASFNDAIEKFIQMGEKDSSGYINSSGEITVVDADTDEWICRIHIFNLMVREDYTSETINKIISAIESDNDLNKIPSLFYRK